MAKTKKYRVSLKVDPMVFRYIDSNFTQLDGAYNTIGSICHNFVTAMLSHSEVKLPSRVSRKYENFVPITLLITEFDFYHYGYICNELQQVKFSMAVRSLVIDDLCRKAAMARILYNQPVTKTIQHFLIDMGFDDGEVNPETLRSIYNRKYKDYEKRLCEFYNDLITDYDTNDAVFDKKSFVQIATTPI
jgi:hypothetical protein